MKLNLVLIIFLSLFACQLGKAQSLKELYNQKDFSNLVKYADSTEELSTDELYYIGYAFFQLEDDLNAIKMYDEAIDKGLDEDFIYFYKGLSLRFSNQKEEAVRNFRLAVVKNPMSQRNHTELGNCFYFENEMDSALVHFYRARELPFEYGDPYLKLPNVFSVKEDFKKALEEFQKSLDLVSKEEPVYTELLKEIGLLEFKIFKNYDKSIAIHKELLQLVPIQYDYYPTLIQTYYALEDFENGDSLIAILKREFEKGNLPESMKEFGRIPIAEIEWNGRKLVVYKYFEEPKETLDVRYKIYLFSEDRKSIDRTLLTEKTFQLKEDGVKHLLCEQGKDGTHHTYPYGWTNDEIDFDSLKKAVFAVLNEKVKPSASSRSN